MNQKRFIALVGIVIVGLLLFRFQSISNDQLEETTISEVSQEREDSDAELIQTDNDPVWGVDDAPLQMVVFSNFQCPHCASLNASLLQLQSDWIDTGKLRVQFRDFPISRLVNSLSAHVAANAAYRQDRYLDYHHMLYELQDEWKALQDPSSFFIQRAEELGLDMQQFEQDYNDTALIDEITDDRDAGRFAGMTVTPGFVINEKYFQGALEYDQLKEELEELLRTVQ